MDGRRWPALIAALLAGGILLAAPPTRHGPPALPLTAAQAWPHAQLAATPSDLPDGTPYQPVIFLTAGDSLGTAPTHDGKSLRVLLRRSDGTVRQLRLLPGGPDSSVSTATVAGRLLAWVESTTGGQQLWSLQLAGTHAPRRITAHLGDARFYRSQYDLVVAGGRVYWVAGDSQDGTEVRSISLSGGKVQVRDYVGGWALTSWPWMIDGIANADGATTLRNITTGATRPLPNSGGGVTACSPIWCRLVSHPAAGETRIEIVHPDGSARRVAAQGLTSTPVIADVAVLDRFEMITQQNDNSYATGDFRLLAYDVDTRRTIEISPDAFDVSYRAGVLWWSTGSKRSQSFLFHALDLRTV
ncbi:MAG TPA: hypothetical protein VGD29_29270 [Actinoplanes sp.]